MLEVGQGRAAEVARLTSLFRAAGAAPVELGYLQPAETLLDLYGEDIRARAYRTDDPIRGEMMLRPDFTVPIVEMHRETSQATARYTYAGPVWRQEMGTGGPNEFWQVGYEVFDANAPEADAEVFALMAEAIDGRAMPVTGDLSFLFAAIDGLRTTDARKTALRRHVWRPNRFRRLLDRFSGAVPFSGDDRDWTGDAGDAMEAAGQAVGLRTGRDVTRRIEALMAEQATDALASEELALIETVTGLQSNAADALGQLQALAGDVNALQAPCDALSARLDALGGHGIDVAALPFDGAFGRATMEYYNGFTFAFHAPNGEAIAMGGRYDALTLAVNGHPVPAVGGIVRPGLLAGLAR